MPWVGSLGIIATAVHVVSSSVGGFYFALGFMAWGYFLSSGGSLALSPGLAPVSAFGDDVLP